MRLKTYVLFLICGTILVASTAAAQTSIGPSTATAGGVAFAGPPARAAMLSIHAEDMDAAPVKGAPFCATVSTEHTQAFADGNRIHTSDNSTVCRDSEGRVRREATLNLLGAVPQESSPKLITIIDPIAGVRYILDSNEKLARKGPISGSPGLPPLAAKLPAQLPPPRDGQVMIYRSAGDGSANVFFKKAVPDKAGQVSDEAADTENLGDQTINGIHATGTRVSTTIPAGKIGNEQPMITSSERWYSPELKATVMTKHDDPWVGELKTEFANVNTSEPDASLFRVPSGYKIVDDKGPLTIQIQDMKAAPGMLPPPVPPPPPAP